jgi:hypothetical protein
MLSIAFEGALVEEDLLYLVRKEPLVDLCRDPREEGVAGVFNRTDAGEEGGVLGGITTTSSLVCKKGSLQV